MENPSREAKSLEECLKSVSMQLLGDVDSALCLPLAEADNKHPCPNVDGASVSCSTVFHKDSLHLEVPELNEPVTYTSELIHGTDHSSIEDEVDFYESVYLPPAK